MRRFGHVERRDIGKNKTKHIFLFHCVKPCPLEMSELFTHNSVKSAHPLLDVIVYMRDVTGQVYLRTILF